MTTVRNNPLRSRSFSRHPGLAALLVLALAVGCVALAGGVR